MSNPAKPPSTDAQNQIEARDSAAQIHMDTQNLSVAVRNTSPIPDDIPIGNGSQTNAVVTNRQIFPSYQRKSFSQPVLLSSTNEISYGRKEGSSITQQNPVAIYSSTFTPKPTKKLRTNIVADTSIANLAYAVPTPEPFQITDSDTETNTEYEYSQWKNYFPNEGVYATL